MASERRFGVEIEHGNPRGSLFVQELLHEHGFRTHGAEDDDLDDEIFDDRNVYYKFWTVGSDGSGVEARTPPLRGEEGFKHLRNAMELLKAHGGYTTSLDGMHVHFEALDYWDNGPRLARLIEAWVNNEGIIDEFVNPYRRKCGAAPKLLKKPQVDAAKKGHFPGGRGSLNVANVTPQKAEYNRRYANRFTRKTIEIRLHEGTLEPDIAIPWIKFGQALLDRVAQYRTRTIPTCEGPQQLLETIKLDAPDCEALLARVGNHKELEGYRDRRFAYIDY